MTGLDHQALLLLSYHNRFHVFIQSMSQMDRQDARCKNLKLYDLRCCRREHGTKWTQETFLNILRSHSISTVQSEAYEIPGRREED